MHPKRLDGEHHAERPTLTPRFHHRLHLIVFGLVSLIDHVQASIKLIETAKLEETATRKEYGDVFLLDDVTPIYVQAGAALETCSASLSTAVQFLLEIDTATAGA